jgi:hypothetical protein
VQESHLHAPQSGTTAGPTDATSIQPTIDPNDNCEHGFEHFMGYCYLFVQEAKTWYDAESACVEINSHLASIHSLDENEFIDRKSNN